MSRQSWKWETFRRNNFEIKLNQICLMFELMMISTHSSPLPRLSSSLIPFASLIRQQCGLRLPIVIRGWRDGTSYVLPQVTNWSRRTLSITASDESLSYSKAFIIFFVFWIYEKKRITLITHQLTKLLLFMIIWAFSKWPRIIFFTFCFYQNVSVYMRSFEEAF